MFNQNTRFLTLHLTSHFSYSHYTLTTDTEHTDCTYTAYICTA